MKLEIRRVGKTPKEFEIAYKESGSNIAFSGTFCKDDKNFLVIDAIFVGELEVICDVSGETFGKNINETLRLKITDSVFKGFDEVYDVIEELGGIFDLYEAGMCEIESIRSGYHRKPEYVDSESEIYYENI